MSSGTALCPSKGDESNQETLESMETAVMVTTKPVRGHDSRPQASLDGLSKIANNPTWVC